MKFYTKVDDGVYKVTGNKKDIFRYYFFEHGRFRIAYYGDRRILFQRMPKEQWTLQRKEDIKNFIIKF